jgi:hypothetical protein
LGASELTEVATRGLAQADMTAVPAAAEFIGQLSTGLPHYSHLMGLHSGLLAVRDEETEVTVEHVLAALPEAVARAQQHVTKLYYAPRTPPSATCSRRCCSLPPLRRPTRGYFAPGDLRAPMAAILGRPVEIPTFAKQLSAFADARGPVLDRTGVTTRPRYRFIEPCLSLTRRCAGSTKS